MTKNLSNYTMNALRGRRGLKDGDTSQDKKIMAMSPERQVREAVAWQLGDPSWADHVASLILETGADVDRLANS